MYLLDTDVVLRLRSARASDPDRLLVAWATGIARQSLFLSALALLELERSALQAERRSRDGGARWRNWIDAQLLPAFEGRVVPVDAGVASRAARLNYATIRDSLVAATALQSNFILVTSRPSAFRSGRVRVLDPWNYSPDESEGDWREASRAGSLWLKTLFVRA